MVALRRISNDPYQCITELYDVHKVANFEKKLPIDWICDNGTNVTNNFHRYARPLIQAELTPIYINGLQRHIKL
jgi:6-phosphofructokinase 1